MECIVAPGRCFIVARRSRCGPTSSSSSVSHNTHHRYSLRMFMPATEVECLRFGEFSFGGADYSIVV